MRSGELYRRFTDDLTPAQQRYAIGWLMGGIGMDVDGYTDSQDRPDHASAKYLQERFADAIAKAVAAEPAEVAQQEPAAVRQSPAPTVWWVVFSHDDEPMFDSMGTDLYESLKRFMEAPSRKEHSWAEWERLGFNFGQIAVSRIQ